MVWIHVIYETYQDMCDSECEDEEEQLHTLISHDDYISEEKIPRMYGGGCVVITGVPSKIVDKQGNITNISFLEELLNIYKCNCGLDDQNLMTPTAHFCKGDRNPEPVLKRYLTSYFKRVEKTTEEELDRLYEKKESHQEREMEREVFQIKINELKEQVTILETQMNNIPLSNLGFYKERISRLKLYGWVK